MKLKQNALFHVCDCCCLSVLCNMNSSRRHTVKSKLKGYSTSRSCSKAHPLPASTPVLLFPENYQYTVLESLLVQSVVARIKAVDADIGSNAEMDYRIMDGDGPSMFNITTDEDTQDGVIMLLKVQLEQQPGFIT